MLTRRIGTLWVAAVLTLGCAPCLAWLYDGGEPQHAGPVIKDPGTPVWVAEPFVLVGDAYMTQFGVAMGRIIGSGSMGFRVCLTDTLTDAANHAIASWTMSPTRSVLEYYYVQPDAPLLLDSGTMYFLVFAPNSNNFWGSISYSQSAGYYGRGSDNYGASWYQMSYPFAVVIDGYYVPEPASLAVLALGLVGTGVRPLLMRRCGSRRAADRA